MELGGILVPITLFIMGGLTVILLPLTRAIGRRMEHRDSSRAAPELSARLERMEHAIDAIATEVERISEGQRFTTKLLSERGRAPESLPKSGPQ